MNGNNRNKPCECGSGIKTKKCLPNHSKNTNQNPRDKFEKFVKEIGEKNNLIITGFNDVPNTLDEYDCGLINEKVMINLYREWFYKDERYYWVIGYMRVNRDFRGKGYGTELMKSIIEISKKYGESLVINPEDIDHDEQQYHHHKYILENETLDTSKNYVKYLQIQWKEMIEYYENHEICSREFVSNRLVQQVVTKHLENWYQGMGFTYMFSEFVSPRVKRNFYKLDLEKEFNQRSKLKEVV